LAREDRATEGGLTLSEEEGKTLVKCLLGSEPVPSGGLCGVESFEAHTEGKLLIKSVSFRKLNLKKR
jgi:hypothetical protein